MGGLEEMWAAWKKCGRSTEMGAASTKWRGLEHAGGPERVEGERDTWGHVDAVWRWYAAWAQGEQGVGASWYDVGCGLGVGACEYGAWDALAVGLGASVGARACLGAIKTCGDV